MCGIILLQEGSRIIPLISAKQLSQNNPVVSDLPKNNYIPLRLNQAGVMPIIFTASILVLPNYLINAGIIPIATLPFLLKSSKLIYWVSYFTLILTFSYFYSTIVLNPKEISEDLQKNVEFDVQEMTDLYIKKIDDIFHLKEKEIMTV